MLQEAIIELPFSGGVDEATAPEHVAPGAFLSMRNAYQEQTGAIKRRPGTDNLGILTSQEEFPGLEIEVPSPDPKRVFVANGRLCMLSQEGYVYDYSQETLNWRWIDHAPEAVVQRKWSTAPGYGCEGSAYSNGLVCTVWTAAGATPYLHGFTITDANTGSTVFEQQLGSQVSGGAIKVITVGTKFVIAWPGGSSIHVATISTTTDQLTFGLTELTGRGSRIFDIMPVDGSTTNFALAWIYEGATSADARARCSVVNTTGFTESAIFTSTILPYVESADETGIGVYAHTANNRICIAFHDENQEIAICSVNLTTMVAVDQASTNEAQGVGRAFAITRYDNNYWELIWSERGQDGEWWTRWGKFETGSAEFVNPATIRTVQRCQLISKPLNHNGRVYVVVNSFDAQSEPSAATYHAPFFSYALLDLRAGTNELDVAIFEANDEDTHNTSRVVAQFAIDDAMPREILGGGQTASTPLGTSWYNLMGWCQLDTDLFGIALPIFSDRIKLDGTFGDDDVTLYKYPSVPTLFHFDFDDPACSTAVDFGGVTLLTGGILSVLDRDKIGEVGFVHQPLFTLGPNVTDVTTGDIAPDGEYQYVLIWKKTDSGHNIYTSRPSVIAIEDIGGAEDPANITFNYDPLNLTNWGGYFNFGATYLTAYRRFNGGAFRELGTFAALPDLVDRSAIVAVQIDDETPADELADNAEPYATGSAGERLPHDPPPSCRFIEVWGNRVWIAGCEKGLELWPSNERVAGEGVSFSVDNVITIEGDGGDISGIKVMDGSLLICKEDRLYRMHGEGANDYGVGATLTRPELISSEYGCIAGHAMLSTKHGIWFLSKRGLCLLDRGWSVTHVGEQFEQTIASFDRLTGACVVPGKDLLLFAFKNDDDSGAFVVFDTANKTWGKWDFADGVNGPTGAVVWRDVVHFVDEVDGCVCHFDDSTYFDGRLALNDMAFKTVIETPWYTTGEKMAWQRVRRVMLLGRRFGNHRIALEAGYDYRDTYTDTATFTQERLAQTTHTPDYMVRWALPHQVCSAVRFKITMDSDPTDLDDSDDPIHTAQGALTAIRLEVGKKPQRSRKLPAEATK